MDTITQEDISPQTERELTLPLSPKRPRTDCTHDNSGKSHFPELLAFWKTSSSSTLQENAGLVCRAESAGIEDEKPHEHQQDAQLIVIPFTRLTTSHTEDAHTDLSEVCLIAAERRFKLLVRDEQPPVTATDKLSSYLLDDEDRALAETLKEILKDACADSSSHPDCKLLGKSVEDEPPGALGLHAGNNEAGRPVQNSASQLRALTVSSSDEGVRCQCDCTNENVLHDTGFWNTWNQSAEAEESNQEWEELGFSENILFSKENEEDNSLIYFTHADSDSFYSNPQPSGNLAQGFKNEDKILELQICENQNVAICNGETKDQVNENGMSINSIPSAALFAEGSIVSYDVVSARNMAIDSASLEADDFCGAKGEEAAGKMIAKALSETPDHTTETPMPARISQGPAEGDNDASPFSVIDPAIWSETDREAKERRCNSASAAAGVELFPSVKVFEMETPLPLCSDVRLPQEVSIHHSRTQQVKDDKEDLWQSYTEPQACSSHTNETHNKAGSDGSCHWKSSPSSRPAKPPPAGDGRRDSHDTVGHQLKEQDRSGCFPVSPDQMKTKEVEYLQAEIARMDGETEIIEMEGMTGFEEEIGTGEHEKQPEHSPDFERKLLQQKEKHTEDSTEISTGDSISDGTEGKISKYDNKLKHVDDALKHNLGVLSDHPYNALFVTMQGTAEEKERKEEASDVHGDSEILVKSEGDHQQQSQQNEDMPEERVSECTERNVSKSGHKLTLVSQHEQENKLSCFSDSTFMVDNKDKRLAFTAFTFNGRMPEGFDTFERIQLSLDGDEDSLSSSPLLTSLPRQLLKSPQQQLHHSVPEAESGEHEELPEEEEEDERCGRHTENMAKGFSISDTRCNEVPNFISAAADDVALGRPEQQPHYESAHNSSEGFQDDLNTQSVVSTVPFNSDCPASDVSDSPKFEKKQLFDMVLKELNRFFGVSMSDFTGDSRASSPEQCVDVTEVLDRDTLNCKEHLSSPKLGCYRDTSSEDADEDPSLDPAASCTSGGADGEQEVPQLCQETSMCTQETHKEPPEMEHKRTIWSPSFECPPLLEQLSYRQPEQTRRLEPLRTCTRPIRVGLSKRAKTKHLHRPHPYK
ncbi:uncharacterized protein [Cebidichthys violaceus]|uniref:uncharacterized protein isoform X1 n=1 Tax=Cebidichthys violaceus TaxID=271503 RepID=UPI0035CAA5C6